MKDLVFTGENDQALTNSLLIAEKFGKNHQHVLRDIKELTCSETFRVSNFGPSSYKTVQGKEMPMYIMTKDGFSFLVMGYTGAQAGKFKEEYINAFNRMEAKIKTGFQIPQTFAEALKLAANQAQEIEEQNKLIKKNKPKVLFADAVSTSQKSCLIGELAKILKQNGIEIGEHRLFQWMREHEYLCSHGERYNLPTQKSMELQLFEIKKTTITKPDGTVLVSTTPKVTGKGQIYFTNKFLHNVNG